MPQAAIEAIAAWLVEYGASTTVATVVATVVVDTIAAFALGKISQALAGTPSNAGGPPSQTITVQGTVEPRRLIYGQVLVGGVSGDGWGVICA